MDTKWRSSSTSNAVAKNEAPKSENKHRCGTPRARSRGSLWHVSCLRSGAGCSAAVAGPRCSTLPARSSHGNRSPRPLPSLWNRPPVVRSFCPQAVSRGRRPFRFVRSSLHFRAGSLRSGGGGRVAPLLALRDLKKKMPTPASAEIVCWVVSKVRECLGESPFYLKGFASRWSENFQAASSLASACGCFSRSSFRSAPPRTLAPLAPSPNASLPASASGSEVFKNGASGMLNLKSESSGSHSSAPRFHVVFVPHTTFQPPVPPPEPSPQVEPFRRPTSIPLDPLSLPAAKSRYVSAFAKTNFVCFAMRRIPISTGVKCGSGVVAVVGCGKHRSAWSSFGNVGG